jgi:hypothetical protein
VTAVIVNTMMKAPTKLFFHYFQYTSVIASCCGSISCTPTRRSRTEIFWARGALLHVSPYTTQYLCIHYSKINAPFSENFSLNHRESTRKTPASCNRIKLTKNVILSTSTAERKNFLQKTQCFALILQKLLFRGHCPWVM